MYALIPSYTKEILCYSKEFRLVKCVYPQDKENYQESITDDFCGNKVKILVSSFKGTTPEIAVTENAIEYIIFAGMKNCKPHLQFCCKDNDRNNFETEYSFSGFENMVDYILDTSDTELIEDIYRKALDSASTLFSICFDDLLSDYCGRTVYYSDIIRETDQWEKTLLARRNIFS